MRISVMFQTWDYNGPYY